MKRFGFYSKEDSNQEIYSFTQCSSVEEATKIFSSIKNLPIDEFKRVYRIKKLD